MICEGFIRHKPPDPTLESTSPSPPQGSIWHRFNIDSTSIRHRFPDLTLFRCQIDAKSTPEEGRARWIRGWGPGGLCLINPSQIMMLFLGNLASRKRCDLKTRKRCDFYSAAQKKSLEIFLRSLLRFSGDFSAISAAKPAI